MQAHWNIQEGFMHNAIEIRRDLFWVGGNDRRLALFENVYPIPRGVSYNAYLLLGGCHYEKAAYHRYRWNHRVRTFT